MSPENYNVGVLGGGQIGSFLQYSSHKFRCRIHTLTERLDCPARYAHGDENLIVAGDTDWLDDEARILEERNVKNATPEWENIDIGFLQACENRGITVCPGIEFFEQMSNRIFEKRLIEKSGGTPVPWREIMKISEENITRAAAEIGGFPCILKSVTGGYDGKDQWSINNANDITTLPSAMKCEDGFILEKRIEIAYECSVGIGRYADGRLRVFPPALNHHENKILRSTVYPGPFPEKEKREIMDAARGIMSGIGDYIGILVIEMFRGVDGKLYINEFAPRPHNSLHATLGHDVSQFDVWLATLTNQEVSHPEPDHVTYLTNILNTEELRRARNRVGQWATNRMFGKIGGDAGFYDYRKYGDLHPTNPASLKERKYGHTAEKNGDIQRLHGAVRSGKLPVYQLMKQLRENFPKRTGIELTIPEKA